MTKAVKLVKADFQFHVKDISQDMETAFEPAGTLAAVEVEEQADNASDVPGSSRNAHGINDFSKSCDDSEPAPKTRQFTK